MLFSESSVLEWKFRTVLSFSTKKRSGRLSRLILHESNSAKNEKGTHKQFFSLEVKSVPVFFGLLEMSVSLGQMVHPMLRAFKDSASAEACGRDCYNVSVD